MDLSDLVSPGYAGFLFGCFCAYWAQETGRDALLWFAFGWLLAPLAALALLHANAREL